MNARSMGLALLCLLSGCASRQPDHFYILSAQPPGPAQARSPGSAPVSLRVSLPSLVDRSEMVINTNGDAVLVMEHERWAAPLADLVTQTLADDMERRRPDILAGGPRAGRAGGGGYQLMVDIVKMTARQGGRLSLTAHWRILGAASGKEITGGEEFSAALGPDGYETIARALSECLAQLAARLDDELPQPDKK